LRPPGDALVAVRSLLVRHLRAREAGAGAQRTPGAAPRAGAQAEDDVMKSKVESLPAATLVPAGPLLLPRGAVEGAARTEVNGHHGGNGNGAVNGNGAAVI